MAREGSGLSCRLAAARLVGRLCAPFLDPAGLFAAAQIPKHKDNDTNELEPAHEPNQLVMRPRVVGCGGVVVCERGMRILLRQISWIRRNRSNEEDAGRDETEPRYSPPSISLRQSLASGLISSSHLLKSSDSRRSLARRDVHHAPRPHVTSVKHRKA